LEAPQRYRPDSLAQICKTTRFSEPEIKRMYRGFKSHCPNGMVKEDTFKIIYAQFFPQGGMYKLFMTLNDNAVTVFKFAYKYNRMSERDVNRRDKKVF